MAKVVPFKGILYNPSQIGDIKDVVSPPYDVISEEEQKALHDRHPQNVIRLDFGEKLEGDNEENNPHTRAAAYFKNWLDAGALKQDESPTFYLTAVEFVADNQKVNRFGLMALVEIEPFSKGIVLPHEQTYSKVKTERLGLLKNCKANFSPIFSFYMDDENMIQTLKDAVESVTPDFDFVDDVDERHRMWRITDHGLLDRIQSFMEDKKLFIADGHHRYETALHYRDWLRETDPSFTDDHPANYIMMYLCSMEDPGLVIFPAHRMITRVDDDRLAAFIDHAGEYFDIQVLPFTEENFTEKQEELKKLLSKDLSKAAFGVSVKDRREFYFLALKDGAADSVFGENIPAVLKELDVTVLTHLIIMKLLGIDQDGLDNEHLLKYSKSEKAVFEAIKNGGCDIGFIMNATKIKQVKDIAESGEIMPRKTTYFYPKALTGLVLNKLTR